MPPLRFGYVRNAVVISCFTLRSRDSFLNSFAAYWRRYIVEVKTACPTILRNLQIWFSQYMISIFSVCVSPALTCESGHQAVRCTIILFFLREAIPRYHQRVFPFDLLNGRWWGLFSVFHYCFSLSALLGVAQWIIDVACHIGLVFFKSEKVVYPALLWVSSQRSMVCQIQEMCFKYIRCDSFYSSMNSWLFLPKYRY